MSSLLRIASITSRSRTYNRSSVAAIATGSSSLPATLRNIKHKTHLKASASAVDRYYHCSSSIGTGTGPLVNAHRPIYDEKQQQQQSPSQQQRYTNPRMVNVRLGVAAGASATATTTKRSLAATACVSLLSFSLFHTLRMSPETTSLTAGKNSINKGSGSIGIQGTDAFTVVNRLSSNSSFGIRRHTSQGGSKAMKASGPLGGDANVGSSGSSSTSPPPMITPTVLAATAIESESDPSEASAASSITATSQAAQAQRPIPEGVDESHSLVNLLRNMHVSWIAQLSPEEKPPRDRKQNKSMRQVPNGHYVLVDPSPLQNPRLITYSKDLACGELGLTEEQVMSNDFLKYFSGDLEFPDLTPSWSTPYALSIMGKRYTTNCPFGNGNGYGDGRAISIGEVEMEMGSDSGGGETSNRRYEFQLKGGGPTPFCRGADGRAVLRSSIREFLASEAMHHLGISTTRALSLIVSDGPDGDTSSRPWYSDQVEAGNGGAPRIPSIDDPRLAVYPLERRKQIIQQLARQKRDPDIMIQEPNAITCRVAQSFARIGHVDLFARRVAATCGTKYKTNKTLHSSKEYQELVQLIWHVAFREFYDEAYVPFKDKPQGLEQCIDVILKLSAERIADMIAGWMRVGFAQGNFNADNCLVGGRTMDYGPFGFMDDYQALFAKWTGSGDHFGFLNQATAGYVNYMVLIESLCQALKDGDGGNAADIESKEADALSYGRAQFQDKVRDVWRTKLGFDPRDESASKLWSKLEPLLRLQSTDWTLFWRQLTKVAQEYPIRPSGVDISTDYEAMLNTLMGGSMVDDQENPFYESLDVDGYKKFQKWIQEWRESLVKSVLDGDGAGEYAGTPDAPWPEDRMRLANPKYVLREWMLVDAYSLAAKGDDSMVLELQQLTLKPYNEGTPEQHDKFYRRAPSESLTTGGTAFMT